jgi:phosphoribosylanthranilate isomerase
LSSVRIKICGITRLDDALRAAEWGAHALGFNFWPRSKRYISPLAAARIIEKLPPFVSAVGLFVNASATTIRKAVKQSGVDTLQLHGDESPEACEGLGLPVLKALAVESARSLKELERYDVAGFVLDTPSAGYGGSGRTFDWTLARRAATRHRVLLAGGLNPDNVAQAIAEVKPYGVDVASGVESAPGIKDADLLHRFISAASTGASKARSR